jgi:amino acid adenylation domain-containing protein
MENNQLKERLAKLSLEQREKLLQKLNLNLKPVIEHESSNEVQAADTEYRLSNDQQRMWTFEQIQGSGAAYNIVFALHMQGHLEFDALEYAFTQLVNQHEVLRTHFVECNDEVRQKVNKPFAVKVNKIDGSHLNFVENRAQIEALVYDLVDVKIELDSLPLFRSSLIQLSEDSNVLVFVLHHILADGWSLGIIEQKISQNYIAWLKGQRKNVVANAIQYHHYVSWQEKWLKSDAATTQLNYWKEQLADAPAYLPLPTLEAGRKDASLISSSFMFSIEDEQMVKLKSLVVKENVSLFMAMMAVFKVTLGYFAGVEEVVVGSPVANRKQKQFDDVVGMFSNTVALRTKPMLQSSFRDYLSSIRQTSLKAFSNQNIPFEQVIDAVCPVRSANYSPLFQVLFALQVREVTDAELSGVEIEAMELIRREIEFDLIFEFFDNGNDNCGVLSYKTSRYNEEMIRALVASFTQVLDIVLSEPNIEILEVAKLLGSSEQSKAISEDKITVKDYALAQKTLIAEQTIVEFGHRQLHAKELNNHIVNLASAIHRNVEDSDNPICLVSKNMLDYWLLMLACATFNRRVLLVNKSDQPTTIEKQSVDILIAEAGHDLLNDKKFFQQTKIIEFQQLIHKVEGGDLLPVELNPNCHFITADLKQSSVTGNALNKAVTFLQSQIPLNCADSILFNSNLPLELRLNSMLWATMNGGKIILSGSGQYQTPQALVSELTEHKPSVAVLLPEQYRYVVDSACTDTLRLLLVNGEVSQTHFSDVICETLVQIWSLPQTGGPALIRKINGNHSQIIAHQGQVYSQNGLDQILPRGICGELVVDTSPLDENITSKTIRLGIRGRVTENGLQLNFNSGDEDLHFTQKSSWINGYLIELAAIEQKLAQQPGIADIIVVARNDVSGVRIQVAYLVPDRKFTLESFKTRLESELNRYEIPQHFVLVNQIPITALGDIDTTKLMQTPVPEQTENAHVVWIDNIQWDIPLASPLSVTENIECTPSSTQNEILNTEIVEASLKDSITSGEALTDLAMQNLNMPLTLVDMFQKTLKIDDSKGITYILNGDGETAEQTYSDLYQDALRVLAGLQQAGLSPKDRVLLQILDNQTMLTGFWACVLGGFVPLVLSCPEQYNNEDNETIKIIDVCVSLQINLVLASADNALGLQALPQLKFGNTLIQEIDVLLTMEAAKQIYQPAPEDTALLLLTSGSTGKPKAVMQSHKALVSRSLSTSLTCDLNNTAVSFNWMPLDHVGGLVMFHILDVYLGSHQVQCPTSIILDKPLRWLDWMSEYKVTTTWSPNFAYALIIENLAGARANQYDWDLSHLNIMVNGGEAVVPKTAKEFVTALHPYGLNDNAMKPAWGMSETCSGVIYHISFAPLTNETDSTFVKVGKPIPGVSIRITDSNNNVVKEGIIGSLQITGPTITQGYLNNEQATADSFTVDGWFITGDLARIEDGVVTITGREKDLIIINGQNYQGQEIEKLIEKVPGILPAHVVACGVRTAEDDTDKLAIFYSLQAEDELKYFDLKKKIRRVVLDGVGLSPSYFILFSPEQFPRTSIGKIQRSLLVKQFGEGEFDHLWANNEQKIPAWFYEPDWVLRNAGNQNINSNSVLIFAANTDFGERLSEEIEQKSVGNVICIQSGVDFNQTATNCFELNSDNKSHWLQLFSALKGKLTNSIQIIYCGGCIESFSEQALLEDWQQALRVGFSPLVTFSQAIADVHENFADIKLDVISYGGFSVNQQESLAPEKGLLQGFIKTLPQEIPNLNCRQIDVCDDSQESVIAVTNEIKCYSNDDTIALRAGKRYVSRLKPIALPTVPVAPKVLNTSQFYIVTGGLGGIGARLTHSLMTNDKVSVLVLGRSSIDSLKCKAATTDDVNTQERLKAWEQLSQCVDLFAYEAVDVCDTQGLKQVIAKYEEVWQKSPGAIFHLAGDSRDVQIKDESLDEMLQSMQAKVAGALAIYQALEGREGVEQVHFGSVNGFFGGYGYSSYSAANSFLSAWCQNLYRKGKPVYCYQWSMWDELGLSRGYQLKRQTEAKGFRILDVERGLMSLKVAMASSVSSILIGLDSGNFNIERLVSKPYRSLQALHLDESLQHIETSVRKEILVDQFGTPLRFSSDLHNNQQQDDSNRELTDTEARIAVVWKEVLKLSAEVKVSDDFFELGGNSLQITRLSSALSEQFDIEVSMLQLFEHSSLFALANHIEQQAPTQAGAIEVISRVEELPLSFSQQRFWFIDQFQGSSVEYNIPMAIRLIGNLNIDTFQKSLDEIVVRHEVLRTTYLEVDGRCKQVIHEATSVGIENVDLTTSDEASQQELIEKYITEEVFKPFNLSEDLILRVMLIKLSKHEHVLLFTMHHIASDGWSLNVLTGEFIALYESHLQGKESPLAPMRIQYADYGNWQCEMMQSQQWQQQLNYWKNKLADLPELHSLPLDAPRPLTQNFQADRLIQEIKPELVGKLRLLAKDQGATLFMLLQSAFSLLLARWSNTQDIVMGVPVAGRDRAEIEGLIGCFINTLVLRTSLSANDSFVELLKQNKSNALEAFSNQNIPFELLVEELNPTRKLAYNPLCQIKFVLQNYEHQELKLTDLEVSPIDNGYDQLHFDLDLTAFEKEDALFFHWGYKTELFQAKTVSRMANCFEALLEEIVLLPYTPVYSLKLVTEESTQQMLSNCMGKKVEENRHQCVHQLFEQNHSEYAEAIAVSFGKQTLSYQTLNEQANRVANYLIQQDIGKGHYVGIFAERSIELVVAMLGILKSGAAYIPIEPKTTKDRLKDIVQDSGMSMILTQQAFAQNLSENQTILYLDEALSGSGLAGYSTDNPSITIQLDETAYVIYTSGSTGMPKGVEVSHKGLMDYCAFGLEEYYQEHLSGAMVVTSHGFDLAIPGLYLPLLSGGTSQLCTPGEELTNLADFLSSIDPLDYLIRLTPMHVGALLELMQNQHVSDAAHVFVIGGDVFPVKLANALQQHFPESQIYNHYGPTETVVGCAIYDITANMGSLRHLIPVGTAMHNTSLYVLNEAMEFCPVGVPGELYVGGVGVAKGYLNQPELTAEKFVVNPFKHAFEEEERLYRTGDIVRYLPGKQSNSVDSAYGDIEFIGRQDDQVKIRGYRIEPSEIANKLMQFQQVKNALVLADGEGDNKKLLAYVIPVSDNDNKSESFISALLVKLKQSLPEYMIPAELLTLSEIPLTANGKLDKKSLPKSSDKRTSHYDAPETETEKQVADIWAELLKIDTQNISRTSDFYELGGQSLLAIRAVATIRNKIEVEVSIADLFDHRLLHELAQLIDKQKLAASLVFDGSEELADDEMELRI